MGTGLGKNSLGGHISASLENQAPVGTRGSPTAGKREEWAQAKPPTGKKGSGCWARPTMESLVCVASQYSGDMKQARVMMGFPLDGRNISLRGGL